MFQCSQGTVLPLTDYLQRWTAEPPPDLLFEVTEDGLAGVAPVASPQPRFEVLPERAGKASPAAPNLVKPHLYAEALRRFGPATAEKRHPGAAIVIPDYAVRMAILDFEEFPASEAERLALLRFRLRKSVPFHVDEAQLAYAIQWSEPKHIEVLTVAIAQPILAEYEGLFTDAGYRVGLVMPSSLAALGLKTSSKKDLTLFVKAAGATLSVLLVEEGRIRLVRCLNTELAGDETSDGLPRHEARSVLMALQQTVAYAEDQLGKPVRQLLLCGFESDQFGTDVHGFEKHGFEKRAEAHFGVPCLPVSSTFGVATQANAGLLGLLEKYAA